MESLLTRNAKLQWNGRISCKTNKKHHKKCNNENSDPCLAILEFTNTPSKSIGMSPAQRFFGRQLRSVQPTMKKFLSPFNVEETKTEIQKAKQHQKKSSSSSYRAGSTDIPDLLSPLLPIVHRSRQVFRTTTCILT